MTSVGWAEILSAWEKYMRAAGAPETSIGLRLYHVGRVGRELGTAPRRVTFDELVEWLASKGWSPNTRRSYRASLRAFYGWAMATGRVTESPAHLLPPVPIPRARPRPTPESVYKTALLRADPRIMVAILLGAQCGLRRSEIAKARTDHLEQDLVGWSLRVAGKGGHVRLVPLPDDLVGLIRSRPEGFLFPSSQGDHLTPHYLGKLISNCLGGGLTTHTLRHRCGTVAYAATRDLRAVQELLGHSKPETTMIYTLVPDLAIRAAMLAAAAA